MKLQLILATAILAISTSAVQAADTRTPDILASVSGDSVQALTKSNTKNIRGAWFVRYSNGSKGLKRVYSPSCPYIPNAVSARYVGRYHNRWGQTVYVSR